MLAHLRRSLVLAVLCLVFFGFVYAFAGTGRLPAALQEPGQRLDDRERLDAHRPELVQPQVVPRSSRRHRVPTRATRRPTPAAGTTRWSPTAAPASLRRTQPGPALQGAGGRHEGPGRLLAPARREPDARPGDHVGERLSTPTSPRPTRWCRSRWSPRPPASHRRQLKALITRETHPAQWGFLGSSYIDVLQLNEGLAKLEADDPRAERSDRGGIGPHPREPVPPSGHAARRARRCPWPSPRPWCRCARHYASPAAALTMVVIIAVAAVIGDRARGRRGRDLGRAVVRLLLHPSLRQLHDQPPPGPRDDDRHPGRGRRDHRARRAQPPPLRRGQRGLRLRGYDPRRGRGGRARRERRRGDRARLRGAHLAARTARLRVLDPTSRTRRWRASTPTARSCTWGCVWPTGDIGIPGPRSEILARFAGRVVGRFILTPSTAQPVSRERRIAAVSVVDAAAAALAAGSRG